MKTLNVLLLFVFFSLGLNAQKFTIPVFPDPQSEVDERMDMFESQVDWIVKNKEKLNMPIVLCVGDLANFDNFTHWDKASQQFEKFDKIRLPYALTLGNHDTEAVGEYNGSAAPGNTNQNLRKTFKFNSFFPTSRFIAQRGRYEAGKSDNAYYTFRTGNTYWLVLTLEFCPRQGAINWANDVVKAYHEYNVIVLTHYHLSGKGEIVQNNAGYGDFSPQFVFDHFLKLHPNIRFVVSGHVMKSAFRVDEGVHHNKIYQILQNYQNEDNGGGYLRLMHFDLDKGTVIAELYSPFYNKYKEPETRYTIEGLELVKPKL